MKISSLPELMVSQGGTHIFDPAEWRSRRVELLELLQKYEYGHIPAAPESVSARRLCTFELPESKEVVGEHLYLTTHPLGLSFNIRLYLPMGQSGPFPVIIDGDDCWRYLSNEFILTAIRRGYALVFYNRTEIVPDHPGPRDFGLYNAIPAGEYGALAAWAWSYHRVVDYLLSRPEIDPQRIGVTGHSRGGKTALLAGAIDERIAFTHANCSGMCGAATLRDPDEGGEKLARITEEFDYWFTPRLQEFVGREDELPIDQHMLKACIAPRALLTTEARDDIWASPRATRRTFAAAREAYHLLGAEKNIGIYYRDGSHTITLDDWTTMLDFADKTLYGKDSGRDFDMQG
ncbi:MAG: acetylxylan esterase [bacterium]